MKLLVTAVPISRTSRRRTGKARVTVVDTEKDEAYRGLTKLQDIERTFEALNQAKVVDIRTTKAA